MRRAPSLHELALLAMLPGLGACGGRDPAPEIAADSVRSTAFSERVVVFLEATPEDIEQARVGVPDETFEVIADDLMFYRAAALEYVEMRRLPTVRLTGRRTLHFVVEGVARRYDFSSFPTLDLVVLFDPGREPRAIAPVDIHLVDEYFRSPGR